jgi:hypothetical protein
MADAKIEMKVGSVSFSGEGEATWLSQQLDKVLEKLPNLAKVASTDANNGSKTPANGLGNSAQPSGGTLAGFLKTKSATDNQTRKFLAAAIWLHDSGKSSLSTKEVTKALNDAKQSKLTNPAQCLNSNVSQGFCEKDGTGFYVTSEGRTEIGE